jgi:hypothetical protein
LRTENGEPFDLSRLHGRPVALLFARDGCACSTKALTEAWSGLRKGHPERVVVVATPKLDHAVLTWAEQTAHVRVLLDAGRETAHQYNAWWFPRAYALDEQGRVTYVQPDTTGDPWAPLQVAALWGEGR